MFSNETIHKLREIHMGRHGRAAFCPAGRPAVPECTLRGSARHAGGCRMECAEKQPAHWPDQEGPAMQIHRPAWRISSILPNGIWTGSRSSRLASCSYIQEARNVIILGATGAGKTFLACSLGVAANRNFYAARYPPAAGSSGRDRCSPEGWDLSGIYEAAEKGEAAHSGRVAAVPAEGGRSPGCTGAGGSSEQGGRPPSSAPSMTPVSGMKICMIQLWRTRFATGSSTTRTRFRSRASQCASAWV